jgi:hypothetical protein
MPQLVILVVGVVVYTTLVVLSEHFWWRDVWKSLDRFIGDRKAKKDEDSS